MTVASCPTWVKHSWNSPTWTHWWGSTQCESTTVGQVLIARFLWLWITSFSILHNQKNRRKKKTQWIIIHMTSPLLLTCSTRVLICMQLSPNVLKEVNQAVTAVLGREELGNQASKVKSKSTMCLSYLRIALLPEGVACPLGNSQWLELQSGLYRADHSQSFNYAFKTCPMV